MKKLISFTIKSDFGMFKKPDINDKIFITYNIIPKTYILGILGAIMGYGGYAQPKTIKEDQIFADFYELLKDIRVAIAPSSANGGIYKKEFIIFNNTTNGDIANITEQTLINPAYKIYLELDSDNNEHIKLIENLKNEKAEFLPYMGKNEFSLCWDSCKEYENYTPIETQKEKFQIKTIIPKDETFKLKNSGYKERTTNYFYLFERLPIGWNEEPIQYKYQDFLYTNAVFKSSESFESIKNLGELYECDEGVICLF